MAFTDNELNKNASSVHSESPLHQNNDGIEQTYGESFICSWLPVFSLCHVTKCLCEYEVAEHEHN